MKTQKLLSPLFLSSLFVLLLNDWVLKATFHNELTGKLSDVAGLFAFPFFFAVFFPKRVKSVYLFTFLFFLYWKSPLSQGMIDFWNGLAIFSIHRVVDYSDYGAFLVLPFSYQYFKKSTDFIVIPKFALLNYMIVVVSLVAFVATSAPTITLQKSIEKNYQIKREYMISSHKDTIRKTLLDKSLWIPFLYREDHIFLYDSMKNKQHSFYSYFVGQKADSSLQIVYPIDNKGRIDYYGIAQLSLNSVKQNQTIISLHSIDTLSMTIYQPVQLGVSRWVTKAVKKFKKDTSFDVDSALKTFEKNVIAVLQAPYQIDSLENLISKLKNNKEDEKMIETLKKQVEKRKIMYDFYAYHTTSENENYFVPLFKIPSFYLRRGKYAEAEKNALNAIRNSPYELKIKFQEPEFIKRYIRNYDVSAKLLSNLPFTTLAYAQLMQDKLKEAKQNIRQAKRYYPENVYTQFNQAVYYTAKEKYEKSLEIFEVLASKPDKALHFYFHYGKTLYLSGQKQEAEKIWQQTEDNFEKQMIEEFKRKF